MPLLGSLLFKKCLTATVKQTFCVSFHLMMNSLCVLNVITLEKPCSVLSDRILLRQLFP